MTTTPRQPRERGEVVPQCWFCFQGPGDEEDLAAATTEEPLITARGEESGSPPPDGPPLPLPTVAPERRVTPVSGIEL